jgi:hypothetical protein
MWAVIQNGVVVNTVVASDSDYKDPNYTWVKVTNLYGSDGNAISTGSLYDGVNFTTPSGN